MGCGNSIPQHDEPSAKWDGWEGHLIVPLTPTIPLPPHATTPPCVKLSPWHEDSPTENGNSDGEPNAHPLTEPIPVNLGSSPPVSTTTKRSCVGKRPLKRSNREERQCARALSVPVQNSPRRVSALPGAKYLPFRRDNGGEHVTDVVETLVDGTLVKAPLPAEEEETTLLWVWTELAAGKISQAFADQVAQSLLSTQKREREIVSLREELGGKSSEIKRLENALLKKEEELKVMRKTPEGALEAPRLARRASMRLETIQLTRKKSCMLLESQEQEDTSAVEEAELEADKFMNTFLLTEEEQSVDLGCGRLDHGQFMSVGQEEIEANLLSFDFDALSVADHLLVPYALCMFQTLGLVNRYRLDLDKMSVCFTALVDTYRNNPYHNFRHALDCAQATYFMIVSCGFLKHLSMMDVLAALLAALAHDAGHPGKTNKYLIATHDPLAILYNDASPLENMHASTLFQLLQEPRHQFLTGLSGSKHAQLRKKVIQCILATDMTKHFDIVGKTEEMPTLVNLGRRDSLLEDAPTQTSDKELLAQLGSANKTQDLHEDLELLCEALVHAADISNVCRRLDIACKWNELVVEEFNQQGDVERERGLKVSDFCDREVDTKVQMSLGFINMIVRPLYTNLNRLGSGNLKDLLANLDASDVYWLGQKDKISRF